MTCHLEPSYRRLTGKQATTSDRIPCRVPYSDGAYPRVRGDPGLMLGLVWPWAGFVDRKTFTKRADTQQELTLASALAEVEIQSGKIDSSASMTRMRTGLPYRVCINL